MFKKYRRAISCWVKSLWVGTCIFCGMSSHRSLDLCQTCQDALPWLIDACQRCAAPLQSGSKKTFCKRCTQYTPFFHQAQALFHYRAPVDGFITRLKFKHDLAIAQVLGSLMAEKMRVAYREGPVPEFILPVPLHAKRLIERGFNQSLELARPVSQRLGIALDYTSCQRIHSTLPQAGLSAQARARNVEGAFAIRKNFKARHVCLIDDVMTTGHTLSVISEVLYQQGVKRIDIWCGARAGLEE